MPAVFVMQSSHHGDGEALAHVHPSTTESLQLHLSTLQDACAQERPRTEIRAIEAASPVIWSDSRSMLFIGHVLTAEDVLQANNPSDTVSQASKRVDKDLAGQMALGHQLGIARTTTKGPGGYGNACLALDLLRPPADEPGELSKLRLLLPAHALGTLTIGRYDYYRSQYTLLDTEAYLSQYRR